MVEDPLQGAVPGGPSCPVWSAASVWSTGSSLRTVSWTRQFGPPKGVFGGVWWAETGGRDQNVIVAGTHIVPQQGAEKTSRRRKEETRLLEVWRGWCRGTGWCSVGMNGAQPGYGAPPQPAPAQAAPAKPKEWTPLSMVRYDPHPQVEGRVRSFHLVVIGRWLTTTRCPGRAPPPQPPTILHACHRLRSSLPNHKS